MRYKGYPAYGKPLPDTGAIFPKDWSIERLRFSIKSNPVKSEIPDTNLDELVTFVPMEAVGEYGGIDTTQEKPLGDVYGGYTYFKEQDILIAKITPCFENGKGAIAVGLKNNLGFGTTELHVLRPLDGISTRWLFYLTLSDVFRKMGAAEMHGAGGQKRVPEHFIKDFRTGIPSLFEQELIADFLDHQTARIDALIWKKKELIEKLKEERTTVINRTMMGNGVEYKPKTGEVHSPWNFKLPDSWRRVRLKYFTYMKGRLGWQNLKRDEYTDSGPCLVSSEHFAEDRIQWEQVNHVSQERFEMAPEIILKVDDILFMKDGAAMGKLAYVDRLPTEACLNSHLLLLRPDKNQVLPQFLYYALKSLAFTAYMVQERVGTTFFGFSEESMGNFPLAFPPINEQRDILKDLNSGTARVDRMINRTEFAIELLTEYRKTIITAATTGKIDVRNFKVGKVK